MEILIWLSQATVPLVGWWILIFNFQKLAEKWQKNEVWKESFAQNFFKTIGISFCHATPENHCQKLKGLRAPLRVELLLLGFRTLSYGLIFLILFGVWNFIPSTVLLLLGLTVFLVSQWWKPAQSGAFFFLGLSVFIFGFESLLSTTSQIVRGAEPSAWIYGLTQNYLPGALIGAFFGALIRLITRMSGVAWWTGINLLISGLLSLSGAWGFFLGDFLMALLEDRQKYSERSYRLRFYLGIVFGVLMLALTVPYQALVTDWIIGQYSVQLRLMQLCLMVFLFFLMESSIALGFFHFYFHRKSQN